MTTPTREKVIQWARESGLQLQINYEAYPVIAQQLERFAAAAREDLIAERDEANKLIEQLTDCLRNWTRLYPDEVDAMDATALAAAKQWKEKV